MNAAITKFFDSTLLVTMLLLGCHCPKVPTAHGDSNADAASQASVLRLLATPERFAGREVGFRAFVRIVFESHGAFMTEDDFRYHNTANALWLDFDNSNLDYARLPSGWCAVEGVFDPDRHGHFDLYGGGILHAQIRDCSPPKPELVATPEAPPTEEPKSAP